MTRISASFTPHATTRICSAVLAIPLSILAIHCSSDSESATPTTTGSTGSGGAAATSSTGGGGPTSSTSGTSTASTSSAAGGAACTGGQLSATLATPWYGDNAARLQAMIDSLGCKSPSYDPGKRPVATFDWDNTMIKNDIGDGLTFWMLKNGKILRPANWQDTSPYLTADAVGALDTACPDAAGQPLSSTACVDEILSIYDDGVTSAAAPVPGANAFDGGAYQRTIEPAYAWAAQILAGYAPTEVVAFAQQAIDEYLAAPQDDTQTIGTTAGVSHWIRIYEPQRDLVATLQNNGFDVWVVSASPQQVVEPFAAKVGVAADHVIGIRLVVGTDGKLTSTLQDCGGLPANSVIPYIEGKRCWINQVIYGQTGAMATEKNPNGQVFAAGDSDTDSTFVGDATALRLVLNRNKKELMCYAYANAGGNWLINPMFIEPKVQAASPYPCSTTACKDASGVGAPCLDANGAPIPDQTDTVYCEGGAYCPPTIP